MAKKSQRKDFEHNHQRKILALINAGTIPTTAGAVSQVDIYHDSWCHLLAGQGPCNCDPEVKVTSGQPPAANN